MFYFIFPDTLICTWSTWGWHSSCHLWICHFMWYTNCVYCIWYNTHQTHSQTTDHTNTASLHTKWPIPQCQTNRTRHATNGIPWHWIKFNVSNCLPWQTTINSQTNRQCLWFVDLCINSLRCQTDEGTQASATTKNIHRMYTFHQVNINVL